MQRRKFIKLIGGTAVAWPLTVRAQQSSLPVIGFLNSGSAGSSSDVRVIGFNRGLSEIGFMDGRNVTIQYRFAEGHYDRMAAMVADFVNQKVAVLAATGGVNTALAAKPASATIPVVFANGSDPVQFGLVESLNRPSRNMTGVSFFTATLEAKRLGLLFELVPAARIFGVLINPTNDNTETQLKDFAQGGLSLGRPTTILKASDGREIEAAFETFTQQRINALLVAADPYFNSQREKIVALAARYELPAIYEWREFAQAGGLASYGTNLFDNYRLAGVYVGRVLKARSRKTSQLCAQPSLSSSSI
jgi:putative tryptophan/tyrosine transport system substrate-binding protein